MSNQKAEPSWILTVVVAAIVSHLLSREKTTKIKRKLRPFLVCGLDYQLREVISRKSQKHGTACLIPGLEV